MRSSRGRSAGTYRARALGLKEGQQRLGELRIVLVLTRRAWAVPCPHDAQSARIVRSRESGAEEASSEVEAAERREPSVRDPGAVESRGGSPAACRSFEALKHAQMPLGRTKPSGGGPPHTPRCAPSKAFSIARVQSRLRLHSMSSPKTAFRLSASSAFDRPRISLGRCSASGRRAQRTPRA